MCYGPFCPPGQYRPEQDVLNAAQGGSMKSNLLSTQVNYLLNQLEQVCIVT